MVVGKTGVELCTDTTGDDVEICNGLDDDCDTLADDLVPDVVCPGQHPGASNVSSWACAGSCSITGCTAGFADVDGGLGNGCECGGIDAHADTCGAAATQTVTLGGTVNVTGKIEAATDSDWVRFNFTDRAAPGNSHPKVQLVDDGGGQVAMDVYTTCAAVATCGSGTGTGISNWEGNWTYTSGPGCCTNGVAHVTTVRVRVYRKLGDAPTCVAYTVRATNP